MIRAKDPVNKMKFENLRSLSKEAPSSSVVYPPSPEPGPLPPGGGIPGGI